MNWKGWNEWQSLPNFAKCDNLARRRAAMATMNISLTEKLKSFVDEKVESGDYSNASEYMRELIRKEQQRANTIAEIQVLLDEGEASGYAPYDRREIETRLDLNRAKKNAA
jgi:antitoxin ParD1/3/4